MTEEHTGPTQRLTRWERIAVGLAFAVMIVISIVVVGRLGSPSGDVVGPIDERPSVDADLPRPVTLKDAYAVAGEWARTWNAGAWPILASARFEFPLDESATPVASSGFFLFTFAAPESDGTWPRLNLAVSRQSGTIYHEDELKSSVEPPVSIDALLTDAPVTAEQAFRVAEEVVGAGYREECASTRREVQVVLDSTNPDSPMWVVVYYDVRDRTVNDLVVRIDAGTGRTTTETRDDPDCDMG